MEVTCQTTKMTRLDRGLALLIVLTLGFLLGILGFSLWDKMPSTVERIAWSPEAQWIGPLEPSYRFYVRRTFYLADGVQAAWLRLSADDDFILYVNGQAIAQEIGTLNNSLGLASQLSKPSQNFNDSLKYRVKTGVHYFLGNTKDWKLTAYVDLTPYLSPGKNTIALAIQKGRKNPRVVVEGAVYPVPGAPAINLTTGATPWQVSTLSETHQQLPWFNPDFPDQSWPDAVVISPVQKATYSRLSQHLFDRLLQGSWIAGTESQKGEVWLRGDWQIPQTRQRAFIRLAGSGEYALLLNGLLVNRFEANDNNQLHMYEVTNFLKTGLNTLAVRLARPLDPDWSAQNPSVTQNDSLGFFLDGWVETEPNSITAPIATDNTWIALNQPLSGWVDGVGQGQPAAILGPPDPQEFQRSFEGNAYLFNYPDLLWHGSLWCLGGIGCALVCAWFFGRFWLGQGFRFNAGAGLLLPGTLFLVGIGLLKHRYAEEEQGFLFVQPQSTPLVLLGFVGIVVLTLLWSQIGQHFKDKHSLVKTFPRSGLWFLLGVIAFVSLGLATTWSSNILLVFLGLGEIAVLTLLLRLRLRWLLQDWLKAIIQAWPSWGDWFLLFLIVCIGFSLRAYRLDFTAIDSDENASFDAIRGILRTGVPVTTSHIWYTRGPAYHYMVALWLQLVGESHFNARFLSVLWGTANLVLAFVFARKITGKVWFALAVTAILALDPSEIWYSRFIRFYVVVQFMSLLTFWSFFKGFIYREGRIYQYIFFIALTLTLLNQEVNLTLLPCFLIGFLFFYRPFRLSVDWPIVLGSFMVLAIYASDGIIFSVKCLTPWAALSAATDSYLKLHLSDVTALINLFFVGPTRMYTLYSFFFFLGFLYFLQRRDGKLVFLFIAVFLNLIVLTILLYQVADRYTYAIYPLFIMLAVYSAVCTIESLGRRFEFILENLLPLRNLACGCIALLLIGNIEPGRVLAGYQDAIARFNPQVFEYVRVHRQPGDVVIANLPSAPAIAFSGLDYYLPSSLVLPFDGVYLHEGRLIDRWAGGVALTNLDQMSHVLETAKRVWLQLDDTQPPQNHQLAQLYDYLQTFGQPVLDTYGVRLRLWQREDGRLPRVPNQGKDLGDY